MATAVEIQRAAEVLASGGIAAFPTETVYGVGAHALNEIAVARIFEAKGRPRFDPLIVHVAEMKALEPLVVQFPAAARALAEQFWPGPLTLVLEKRSVVPDLVTAGQPTVAIRVPAHPVAQDLLRQANIPVAAPSANRFGAISPTRAEHVELNVDILLDGGPCPVGVESTIVSFAGPTPYLLRAGGVALEALTEVVGPIEIPPPSAMTTLSPGRQARHYAPRTRLFLDPKEKLTGRIGYLGLEPPEDPTRYATIEVLSATKDLKEAAARLFAALRRLDAENLDAIEAMPVPETGLGRAIMDRLTRAAAKADRP